jgi:hypothetical protein
MERHSMYVCICTTGSNCTYMYIYVCTYIMSCTRYMYTYMYMSCMSCMCTVLQYVGNKCLHNPKNTLIRPAVDQLIPFLLNLYYLQPVFLAILQIYCRTCLRLLPQPPYLYHPLLRFLSTTPTDFLPALWPRLV